MNSKFKSSFRTPAGYFDRVQDHWKIEQLDLKSNGGFKTPEGYFEKQKHLPEKKKSKYIYNFNPWLYGTAATVIFSLVFFLENNRTVFALENDTVEETVLLSEEEWENELLYQLEPASFSTEGELVLEASLEYYFEDDRFVNLIYEDYE